MVKHLTVVLGRTHDRKPLASIDGLPGAVAAELTPVQCRALAAALIKIADDCEGRPMTATTYRRESKQYVVKEGATC